MRVGGPRLLSDHGLGPLPATQPWADDGSTVLHVLVDGEVLGAVALADEVRPESRQAVDALHRRAVEVVMITGDAPQVAEAVAGAPGSTVSSRAYGRRTRGPRWPSSRPPASGWPWWEMG